MVKKIWKIGGAFFLANLVENLILLLIYGVEVFTKQNMLLLSVITFAFIITLKQLNLVRE